MKLHEMYNIEPIFAWFEPSKGPEDLRGVRLAFIEPIAPKFDSRIEDATQKKDTKRAEETKLMKDNYLRQGQKFFTPDLGWWMSEEDFHNGSGSFKGHTKGNVFQKYPDLQIFSSREEATKAAEKAGII